MIKKFGIAQFLLYLALLLSVAVATLGWLASRYATNSLDSALKTSNQTLSDIEGANLILKHIAEVHASVSTIIAEKDPDILEAKIIKLEAAEKGIFAEITKCGDGCSGIQKIFAEYQLVQKKSIDAAITGKQAVALEIYLGELSGIFERILVEIENYAVSVKMISDEIYSVMQSESAKQNRIAFFIIIFVTITIILSGFILRKIVNRELIDVATRLEAGAQELSQSSEAIANASSELSESSQEQASAIQQTVSAISEISATIDKNAEMANTSNLKARTSLDLAQQGKLNVEEMSQAIEDIRTSNNLIVQQLEKSNREVSDIVHVISEISDKTKVINDIVFQTKLLSFNASVEAARAGENGKGFAVVAEEVGNLANMSGTASQEISELIEKSIERVKSLVDVNQREVQVLTAASIEKIEVGTFKAQSCGQSLDSILGNVEEVGSLVTTISQSSNEQSIGVQEISKAMNQLDQVTQRNSQASSQAATSATALKSQSENLYNVVGDVMNFVKGERKDKNS